MVLPFKWLRFDRSLPTTHRPAADASSITINGFGFDPDRSQQHRHIQQWGPGHCDLRDHNLADGELFDQADDCW